MADQWQQAIADHQEQISSQEHFKSVRRYSQGGSFSNLDTNISARPPFSRNTYEAFRPGEAITRGDSQQELQDIMHQCLTAYETVGVIKSVVDMMSELAVEGIEIVHDDKTISTFYKNWAKRVNLEERAERFLSWYFKVGNVAVRRQYGQLENDEIRLMKNNQNPSTRKEIALSQTGEKIEPGRIPLKYVFYNPINIEVIGGNLSSLSNNKKYALRIALSLADIQNPKNDLEREVFDGLPQEVKDLMTRATNKATGTSLLFPIESDKLHIAHYKKDDSAIWAKSFIYGILPDVLYNSKVKLSKTAALDGMLSPIYLWKLGDHKEKILPSTGEAAKLAAILEANTGAGRADILWNSAIAVDELIPPIEKLKDFKEDYHSILLGLGVPEALVGGEGANSNLSSSYIGLKNMVKRLEDGRRALTIWLEAEIDIIQRNMGFRKRPYIRFTSTDLHDERTYFNLLVQLIDRNIISDQTVLERIDEIPEFEAVRIARENQARESGKMPPKASPYHKPELESMHEHELDKIDKMAEVNKEKMENSGPSNEQTEKPKKQNGRPPGSTDKVTRKRRPDSVKASTGLLLIEAEKIYDAVDERLTSLFLSSNHVKNVRSLTSSQKQELDQYKHSLFPQFAPTDRVTDENIILASEAFDGPYELYNEIYKGFLSEISAEKVTIQQKRLLRIQAYTEAWKEELGY